MHVRCVQPASGHRGMTQLNATGTVNPGQGTCQGVLGSPLSATWRWQLSEARHRGTPGERPSTLRLDQRPVTPGCFSPQGGGQRLRKVHILNVERQFYGTILAVRNSALFYLIFKN